jgi:hypothetical protein
MPESGTYGSVRGAAGNSRPYRERLDGDPIHARRREASEKRQGTKSRLVGRRRCSGRYGDLAGGGMVGGNRIGSRPRPAGGWRTVGRGERASSRWPAVPMRPW